MDRESTTQPDAAWPRIAFTGGGTGGHVSPILAVFEELRSRGYRGKTLWIGSKHGAEREAAIDQGIPFKSVSVGKLRRYISLRTVPDAARVPLGVVQSLPLIRRFRPDVIFSTGGYVGVPAVVAGRLLGVPSLTHEQTAVLGLATRINARFSHRVALSHALTPQPRVVRDGAVVITGNPVRGWLRSGDKQRARCHFDLVADRPLLYVTGGAQGALVINDAVGEALPDLLESVEIVHQTGPNRFNGSFERLLECSARLPDHLQRRYHPIERVGPELADLYAAADLVVGRSGAGTVAELAGLGLPSVLVPLPGAEEQRANARLLASTGAAVLLDQSELTAVRLLAEVRSLASDTERREAMSAAARTAAGPDDPAASLVNQLFELAGVSNATAVERKQ